ncbi:MAG: hypothetical protein M1835_007053 [Candelina submexicana]|nr:MAG: hypothetical protein M1835_007053 [Candelina submexicana]
MSTLAARLPATLETTNGSSSTPAGPTSYTHGLNGVDQPMNHLLVSFLWLSMAGLCIFIFVARFTQMGNAYIRHLFSLSATSEQLSFWAENRTRIWPKIKKHFTYAPIWKKRHNREIRLSTALNFGTLPSRFHLVLLTLYVLSNLAYCTLLDYGQKDRSAIMADLRGRTGVLAVANMIPLVLLAGRNNPLIPMLKVSFDTYNLLHRWMGRIVILESFIHTLAWAINNVWAHGWPGINESLKATPSFRYGMLGTVAMLLILIQSPSPIRHAFYETFLHLHQLLAFLAILGVYAHIKLAKLPQLPSIRAVVAIWVIDRLVRWARIIYYNVSRTGFTTVTVEALPGEACRVTFNLVRHGTFTPGCHIYAYIPSISLWMSHPFSVAWSEDIPALPSPTTTNPTTSSILSQASTKESHLPTTNTQTALALLDVPPPSRSTISLVISARTGMTRSLYTLASNSPSNQISLKGLIEGPYGGLESLHSYGTIVLFAAGIGITHQVSHVRDLLQGYDTHTVAARKIILIWSVRNTEHLEWIRPFMDSILQMPGRRDVLKVLIFVTKPKSAREVVSPSRSVQMFPGRANPGVLLDREIVERVGAMVVTVCGPGAFADEVRGAVRRRVQVGRVDFVEEAFTW